MPKISELTDSGAIQPGDSVPAVRSGSTVEIWPTVEQPASVSGTDTYTSDLGVDVSAGDKVCADLANANTSTTPTLENTGGTPGSLTITTRDGSALWAGALSGVHTLQLASGGGSWMVTDPNIIPNDDIILGERGPSNETAQWSSTPQHIFRPDIGKDDPRARAWPHVLFDAYGKKALLFSRRYRNDSESPDTPSIATGLAFSDDGINWQETQVGPVFDEILQSWQGSRAWIRTITWDEGNGRWVAFAGGNDDSGTHPGVRQIGVLYSDDLITWTADAGNPVITVDTDDISTWAPSGADAVYPDEVFEIDGTWYLFIDAAVNGVTSGTGDEEPYVGLMQASDPAGPWTSAVTNPIFDGSEADWLSHVSCRHVMKYRGKWYMSVQSRAGADELLNIGIATADAIAGPWSFTNTSNPLIQTTDKYVGALMVPTPHGWTIQAGDHAENDGLFVLSERADSSLLRTKTFNGAELRRVANQAISNATLESLSFDSVHYDRGKWYDSGSPTRITIRAGVSVVRVTATIFFESNSTGRRSARVLVNGADPGYAPEVSVPPLGSGNTVIQLTGVLTPSVGDYIEVGVYQDSGGSLNVSKAAVTVEQVE